MKSFVIGFVLSALMMGCQTGGCHPSEEVKNVQAPTSKPSTSAERVLVYKYDGTAQCGQGKEIPLTSMTKELTPIKAFRSFKKNDGQMRIQLCGTPSGEANVFEIGRDDLAAALKKGFKEWVFE